MRRSSLVPIARRLRGDSTDAERKLWSALRRKQFGRHFRRQHPIGDFVADFCAPSLRLVIEVDGGQHDERRAEDAARSILLHRLGFDVVRFWNHDVLARIDSVLESIRVAVEERLDP